MQKSGAIILLFLMEADINTNISPDNAQIFSDAMR